MKRTNTLVMGSGFAKADNQIKFPEHCQIKIFDKGSRIMLFPKRREELDDMVQALHETLKRVQLKEVLIETKLVDETMGMLQSSLDRLVYYDQKYEKGYLRIQFNNLRYNHDVNKYNIDMMFAEGLWKVNKAIDMIVDKHKRQMI